MKKKFENIESLNNYYYFLVRDLADNSEFLSKKFFKRIARVLERNYQRDFNLFNYNSKFDLKQAIKKEKSTRQAFKLPKQEGLFKKFGFAVKSVFSNSAEDNSGLYSSLWPANYIIDCGDLGEGCGETSPPWE